MPTAEGIGSVAPGCVGWRRAYVGFRVKHSRRLDAVGFKVCELGLELVIHQLLESAVEAGWNGARHQEADR